MKRRAKRLLNDLDQEIREHIELATQENIARGMTREEARHAARLKFGNVTRVKEDTREVWATVWLEQFVQDVRFALRGLRKTPVFTVVAILTLAIGIGANTTIFSAINALLLRPLPYPDQDRLVRVSLVDSKYPRYGQAVSWTDVAHWKAANDVFEQIEGISGPDIVAMSGGGGAGERAGVQHCNVRMFPLLGLTPLLGSIPIDDKTESVGLPGVALSYEFWQRHFAGDPKVLGRQIFVDTFSGPIVAVMNPGFDLLGTGAPDIFEIDGSPNPGDSGVGDPRWIFAIAKLKRGVSIRQAQAGMDVVGQHLAQAFPQEYKGMGVRVEPLRQGLFGWSSDILYFFLAAVGFVLLIACANVANLLLVRADSRRKEIGVRVALGAGRTRLIRQLLTESIVLFCGGGLAGLVLSIWGVKLFNLVSPNWMPRRANAPMDARILAFTFGICVLTGIVFGLAPAFRASKNDVNETLRDEGRATSSLSRNRTRNSLVIAEIAIALVLLICAGLMINTLTRVLHTNPGFNAAHLITAQVRLAGDKYIDATDPQHLGLNVIHPTVGLFCRQVLERLQALPGVEAAAFVDWLPLLQEVQHARPAFRMAGQAPNLPRERSAMTLDSISPNYFSVMGIPILRGRGIEEQDTESAAWVVIINETMAHQFWPNQDPIGQVITFDDSPDERPRQIVGIIKNVKDYTVVQDPMPQAFVAYTQLPARMSDFSEARLHKSLIVRSRFVSKELMQSIRQTISELAPDSAVFGVTTVQQTVSDSAGPWRFFSQLLGLFAAVALLLAAIGIYGVISYSVSQRSHEIGLRMALGAEPAQVLGMVLRQAMILAVLGVAIGVAASFLATPLLADVLYGVKSHDALTITLVSLVLIVVTLCASYIPARRAAHLDPMQTLRHE
ncbi:MAG TPA: ABC transporter permease [Verrucomicrobiae bacterium]|nr:ABC transporter permease [Verrucomicrobiae bacterium]